MSPGGPPSPVSLASYDNSGYDPGRSRLWQIAWFFFGLPILRSPLIPGSALRRFLLRSFGAAVGRGVVIKPGVRVKYPWLLRVGDHAWIGEDCWIDNLALVTIGGDACLSQGSYLCTGNHDWKDRGFGLVVKPIAIGQGAWVGARAMVSQGVEMGIGSIAAAGSVVACDVPPMEIFAGNPARFIRKRLSRQHPSGADGGANAPGQDDGQHTEASPDTRPTPEQDGPANTP